MTNQNNVNYLEVDKTYNNNSVSGINKTVRGKKTEQEGHPSENEGLDIFSSARKLLSNKED